MHTSSRFPDSLVLFAWLIVSTDDAIWAHIVDPAKIVHLPALAAMANLDIDGVIAHDIVFGIVFTGHLVLTICKVPAHPAPVPTRMFLKECLAAGAPR